LPDLYPLISPPRRPLALGRGRILISGFIQPPPILAVYLPLGGAGRGFSFTEGEIRRHFSYLSGTFRELTGVNHILKSIDNLFFLLILKLFSDAGIILVRK
jgi:hypothetical protein